MSRPVIQLTKDLSASILSGHPWVFDRALAGYDRRARGQRRDLAPGEVVSLFHDGSALAVAFVDPGAPIAARVISLDIGVSIDGAWAREQARSAAAMRAADPALQQSDAMRIIHGESDFMPGLVLDLYRDTAVVVFDGTGAEAFWRPLLPDIADGLELAGYPVAGLWARKRSRKAKDRGELAFGDEPPDRIVIKENGARFYVDVRRGQKTGFFLDQRDNRKLAATLAAGADVLNLFGYTGGFSVHAALAGARSVTTVDIAAPAIAAAKDNFVLNGLELAHHRFESVDVRAFLDETAAKSTRYDVVICDPPSYAPSARARGPALEAYRSLNAVAMKVVVPGGVLLSASCSSHIDQRDLVACLAEAARRVSRRVRLRELRGSATDHPVRPGFPEGHYLDLLVAYVD